MDQGNLGHTDEERIAMGAATGVAQSRRQREVVARTVAGGSFAESLASGAAAALAIIGLAGYYPFYMAAIAALALGGALIAQGGAATARWNQLARALGDRQERVVTGGLGAELLGGAAGVVLGVLALAGVAPGPILSVAALVFGATTLLGSAAQPDLSSLETEGTPQARRLAREAVQAAGGGAALAGLAACVLGILALIGVGSPLSLTLVAFLTVGGGILIVSNTVAGRLMQNLG